VKKDALLSQRKVGLGYSLLTYPGYVRLRHDETMRSVAVFEWPHLREGVRNPPPQVIEDNLRDVVWAIDRDMKERGVA